MAERYIGRIMPGQDLCDINGDKVGSVARVYREDENTISGAAEKIYEDVIEVKTGFFGLGEKLYVPVSAVDDTTEDAVFVDKPRTAFDEDWHKKPEYFDRLT